MLCLLGILPTKKNVLSANKKVASQGCLPLQQSARPMAHQGTIGAVCGVPSARRFQNSINHTHITLHALLSGSQGGGFCHRGSQPRTRLHAVCTGKLAFYPNTPPHHGLRPRGVFSFSHWSALYMTRRKRGGSSRTLPCCSLSVSTSSSSITLVTCSGSWSSQLEPPPAGEEFVFI